MAVNKRTYPNQYYAWYNDDDRIAIVTQDTTATSGERTIERYDTFQGDGSTGSITAIANHHSTVSGTILVTSADHGLSTSDSITVSGTTDYNGTFTVTKVSKDTFYYTETYSSSQTGTWEADNVVDGIRVTFHSKYEEITAITQDLKTNAGLDSALHNAVLCYVKARLYEDAGNFQEAQYFRMMYEAKVRKHRSRKSGVRFLSVPRL